jgi:uncharacterized protein YdcH (DUF465 family)
MTRRPGVADLQPARLPTVDLALPRNPTHEKGRRLETMELHPETVVNDPEYRRLRDEHREHEQRLQTLSTKSALTEEEELEEKRLKKEKLALKDKMEAIARHHRDGVAH